MVELKQWFSTVGPRRFFAGPQNILDFPSNTFAEISSSRPNRKGLAFKLNSVKPWPMTCSLRLNRLDSAVSYILSVCTPSGMSRVFCGASIVACTVGHAAVFAVNAALVASQWQHVREPFSCTHLLTSSTRLDKPKYCLTSLRCDPMGNRNQSTSFDGVCFTTCIT